MIKFDGEDITILYLDTNIFLDFVQNRVNKLGADIATPAAKLFLNALECKYYIAVSTWALKQIYDQVRVEEIAMLFNMIRKKIIPVKYENSDIQNAKLRSAGNLDDALHIVLAEKIKAKFIITRNINDFLKIGSKISIRRPEDV